MSAICVSNILPSRTRSGLRRERVVHESRKVQEKQVPTQSPDELRKELTQEAILLYDRQISYLKAPGDRLQKFDIMSDCQTLCSAIKESLATYSKLSSTIQEIQNWVELLCWNTRISVFNQSVCVA
jgi:hypothetical protein